MRFSWLHRRQALQSELKKHKLSRLKTQHKVIQTLEQETADPNWTDLAEGQDYDDYYDHLGELCKRIAETYGSARAWHALVYSTDNIDSVFGRWITAQPQAFPLYLEMLRSGKNGRSGFAKEALAYVLAGCRQANSPFCSSVLAKHDELMGVIRSELFAEFSPVASIWRGEIVGSSEMSSQQITSTVVVGSIEALGTCGTDQDLLLLRELAMKYASEVIDPSDADASNHRQGALWLIHNAEQKIKDRM